MADIVISEFMDQPAVDSLSADFSVNYDPMLVEHTEQLKQAVAECKALIVRNRTQVQDELLQHAPQLKVVGRLGVGLDNIDVAVCAGKGIEVMPATGANTVSVAEYVIAGMLMLVRGAYHATGAVLKGEWPRQRLQGGEIAGRRLGLVGLGDIGREVALRAAAFGMKIGAFDPFLPPADPRWRDVKRYAVLDELLADSQVLSLHVPLSADTKNLIDRAALDKMPADSVLINSARGGIVDENALAGALRAGKIAGAMLDVFADEPLPAESALAGTPNLILTPHIAGVTQESNRRVSEVTAQNVRRVLEDLQ